MISAPGTPMDKIDLDIMRLLNVNCRISYRAISSAVGISTNAVKTRVNKMMKKGIIQKFVVTVNPATFGYERQCFLIVRNADKIDSGTEEKRLYLQPVKRFRRCLGLCPKIGGCLYIFIFI